MDTTICNQTQITYAKHEPSYKQPEVKTDWTFCERKTNLHGFLPYFSDKEMCNCHFCFEEYYILVRELFIILLQAPGVTFCLSALWASLMVIILKTHRAYWGTCMRFYAFLLQFVCIYVFFFFSRKQIDTDRKKRCMSRRDCVHSNDCNNLDNSCYCVFETIEQYKNFGTSRTTIQTCAKKIVKYTNSKTNSELCYI